MARRVSGASCRLDKVLHEGYGVGMSEFEILDRLAERADVCMKMQELGEAVHLTQSALSRAVARLEKEGLVERSMCSEDRRAISVQLTDSGRTRWSDARPAHRSVVEEFFGQALAALRPTR
ncbi:DNA-binding MarR family transcriptional regulator [Actinocorallia herbida]|uniref:DNA-binding MarR family transcriptional regulator n=2 Tax=Actinocorallia herbida TaxID=58109 RepID=A0A3N1D4X5_9ACTN|nr:DNA-binding MarR family transcriptional regulator [Actinocorallia herbida]